MIQTTTVPGSELSEFLFNRQMNNQPVRSLTRGDTNGVWRVEWDDMADTPPVQEDLLKEES